MKKFLVLLLFSLIFIACKDDPVNPPADGGSNLYPVKPQTRHEYDLTVTSNDTNYTASRSITNSGRTVAFRNVQYSALVDSLFLNSNFTVSEQWVRSTEGGVYFHIDTTGLSGVIPPDFLPNLHVDTEFRLLALPLSQANEWIAYRIELRAEGASIPLVEVRAFREVEEAVNINLTSGTINRNAVRVRYDAVIRTPNPSNPFTFNSVTYSAHLWYSNDIGLVRVHGNGIIFSALTSGSFSLGDTTTTATQDLRAYFIP
jgi:hypothetical protein